MITIEQIKKTLIERKEELKRDYQVKDIGIFGSYVRGEQKKKSDVDILVEFDESSKLSLLDFIGLENYLTDILGVKVDLVEKGTLKPRIGKHVLEGEVTDMIGEVGSLQTNSAVSAYKKVDSSGKQSAQETVQAQPASSAIKDTVTLNTPPEKEVTYSSALADQERFDSKFIMLRALVANMFKSQGLTVPTGLKDVATAGSAVTNSDGTTSSAATTQTGATTDANSQGSSVIDIGDGKTADIATMTPEEAKKLVAENGYWGIKQTAERIFQQSVAISGNDPGNIDKIKEGILNGFGAAKSVLGGELPDISSKTLDAVMKKLDDWVKNPDQTSGQVSGQTDQTTVPV